MNITRLMLSLLFVNVLVHTSLEAATLPEFSQDKHMGVATCASSVCHGQSTKSTTENVLMNEYRTWLAEDDHARAYKTLLKPASKRMAKKLGLTSAHTAKICLDCHADNVPKEKRGKRFQITDGVGCEACHGGAERWLSDHKEEGATHAKNMEIGLYPSEKPRDRAKLCLSCHLGTKDKFATHKIMGAGHPRLSFELESFTQNQPAHYSVDADYEKRKGSIHSVNMWLTGLIYKARGQMELLQSKQFRQHGLFPELAFYECQSCHRAMSPSSWPIEPLSSNVAPGSVRLDDAAMVILVSVLDALDNSLSTDLKVAIKKLHNSSTKNKAMVVESAKSIVTVLDRFANSMIDTQYTTVQKKRIRKQLLSDASQNAFRDYTSAEQVIFAVDTLSIDLKDENKYVKQIDKLYETLYFEDKYYPDQFKVVCNLFLKVL
ncbi:MAG: cytochrome c family protein [Proteobacteria bacterium]|nr:cytochrome c family protein [Pseudomonadota bacterium]